MYIVVILIFHLTVSIAAPSAPYPLQSPHQSKVLSSPSHNMVYHQTASTNSISSPSVSHCLQPYIHCIARTSFKLEPMHHSLISLDCLIIPASPITPPQISHSLSRTRSGHLGLLHGHFSLQHLSLHHYSDPIIYHSSFSPITNVFAPHLHNTPQLLLNLLNDTPIAHS